ncbi:hypothetical protein GCM10023144_20410 [Pigmentiphaga soli]|uniref:Uncharacterized protein n=1 Tax=Pigmentiphaga soli TaxID=1007095 RepID=A0ABP8GXZ3_9BURK
MGMGSGDGDAAPLARCKAFGHPVQAFELVQGALDQGYQGAAGGRQTHEPVAATLEQFHPEFGLDVLHVPADPGLGGMRVFRRRRHAEAGGDDGTHRL